MSRRSLALLGCFTLLLAAASVGAAPVSHEVRVGEQPVRVWEKGAPAMSNRILLLHGLTWSTLPNFDLQVPGESLSLMDGLVVRGIRAFGMDQRGYGETPRDASGWLWPEKAAGDVIGVLSWLREREPDVPAPYLFGWSYGAALAQLVVQQRPDLVSGLVLFGYPIRPGFDRDPEDLPETPPAAANTALAAASDFILPGAISRQAVDTYVAAALEADPRKVDWRRREQWRALDATGVRVPTLLLQAEHDPLALDDVHSEFFSRLGTHDRAWVVIPESGHAAFLEHRRDYFLDLIATFLNRGAGAERVAVP